MGRRKNPILEPGEVTAIQAAMEGRGLNQRGLAKLLGITEGTVTKMLKGAEPNASLDLLGTVVAKLGVGLPRLFPQADLFELDPAFIEDARRVLESLRRDAGDVEGDHQVTALVGLHFHGPPPERRAIERRFQVRLIRKAPAP